MFHLDRSWHVGGVYYRLFTTAGGILFICRPTDDDDVSRSLDVTEQVVQLLLSGANESVLTLYAERILDEP